MLLEGCVRMHNGTNSNCIQDDKFRGIWQLQVCVGKPDSLVAGVCDINNCMGLGGDS